MTHFSRTLSPGDLRRKEALKHDARDTLYQLPEILRSLGTLEDARNSKKYSTHHLRYLDPKGCPRFSRPAVIRVLNMDTVNAAIKITSEAEDKDANEDETPPLIVNFANPQKPGGGWLNGQIAQEETLCYRSSLAHSLHQDMYPLRRNEIIYSPYVLVIRGDLEHGHRFYTGDFPVVSCVTVAALRNPTLRTFTYGKGRKASQKTIYAKDRDRNNTKTKMRQTLRVAAAHEHHSLVLGALGCGVYNNPPEEVAHCWLEVLREREFEGNWWRNIFFAVYDPGNNGNYAIFDQVLSGRKV